MDSERSGKDEPTFEAEIDTVQVGPELYRAVLVLRMSNAEGDESLRIELAGEHLTRREAAFAAKLAIEAMSKEHGSD